MDKYLFLILIAAAVFAVCDSHDDFRPFLRDLEQAIHREIGREDKMMVDKSCSCEQTKCSCCVTNLKLLNGSLCGNVAFEPDLKSVNFSLTLAGRVIASAKISTDKPRRLCQHIGIGKLCVNFSKVNVDLKAHTFSACADATLKTLVKTIKIPLGCFKLPPHSDNGIY